MVCECCRDEVIFHIYEYIILVFVQKAIFQEESGQLIWLECGSNKTKVVGLTRTMDTYFNYTRHCGRVVKATDYKLIGLIPRRFYSCQCRIFCILYCQLLYKPFSHFHKQTVHILTFTHTKKPVTKYLGLTCIHTLYLETGNIFPLYVLQYSVDYLYVTIMGTLFILSSI